VVAAVVEGPARCAASCAPSCTRRWTDDRRHKLHRERKCAEIIINDTLIFFLNCKQHFDNFNYHNSFRVLTDKISSAYFTWKIYLCFSIGNDQPREPALCQLYRHTFVPYSQFSSSAYVYLVTDRHTVRQTTTVCSHIFRPDANRFIGMYVVSLLCEP